MYTTELRWAGRTVVIEHPDVVVLDRHCLNAQGVLESIDDAPELQRSLRAHTGISDLRVLSTRQHWAV